MEDLIAQADQLFEEQGAEPSPPLPPAPPDEPQASVGYGSSYTLIATLPPKPQSSVESTEDFTPQLPPRPEDSIHPSRRTRPISEDRSQLASIADTSTDGSKPPSVYREERLPGMNQVDS